LNQHRTVCPPGDPERHSEGIAFQTICPLRGNVT
jgi:hypothetical protein